MTEEKGGRGVRWKTCDAKIDIMTNNSVNCFQVTMENLVMEAIPQ